MLPSQSCFSLLTQNHAALSALATRAMRAEARIKLLEEARAAHDSSSASGSASPVTRPSSIAGSTELPPISTGVGNGTTTSCVEEGGDPVRLDSPPGVKVRCPEGGHVFRVQKHRALIICIACRRFILLPGSTSIPSPSVPLDLSPTPTPSLDRHSPSIPPPPTVCLDEKVETTNRLHPKLVD